MLGLDCWRDRDNVQRRVGFVPGEFALYERLTGGEMLDYLATLRVGVARSGRRRFPHGAQVAGGARLPVGAHNERD